jgi:hypothetical protein
MEGVGQSRGWPIGNVAGEIQPSIGLNAYPPFPRPAAPAPVAMKAV